MLENRVCELCVWNLHMFSSGESLTSNGLVDIALQRVRSNTFGTFSCVVVTKILGVRSRVVFMGQWRLQTAGKTFAVLVFLESLFLLILAVVAMAQKVRQS